ncbi:MAG: hypothetical protein KDB27_33690, partial [Planctomycetales bacterium]|nr:hypothetical protein [Planctomycetales bacterium]
NRSYSSENSFVPKVTMAGATYHAQLCAASWRIRKLRTSDYCDALEFVRRRHSGQRALVKRCPS